MSYLNETGLAYFWGKIKAWANSVFALLGHTHPSSDVTAMTGYSMPASTGAISSGDTLNQAVGKLEKAVTDADISNVVHKTGNEIIAGDKIFTNEIKSKYSSFTKGTAPSSIKTNVYYTLIDSTNVSIGGLYFKCYTDGSSFNSLLLYNPFTADASDWDLLGIGCDTSQIYYGFAPSTSTSRTDGNDILTRNWIPKDARIVHTTGNETIAGAKTFTSDVNLTGSYPQLISKTTSLTRGTAPATGSAAMPIKLVDSVDNNMWGLYHRYYSTKKHTICLLVYKGIDNSNNWTSLGVGYDENDIAYAWAPSTSGSRTEGTDVITRDWIPNDTRIVHTTENETVNGQKVFTENIHRKTTLFSRGTASSGTIHVIPFNLIDSSGNDVAGLYYKYYANKSCKWSLLLRKSIDASSDYTELGIGYSDDGTIYTFTPTPALNSNSSDIVNTAWIRSATGNTSLNAATATKLANARTIRTNLASTSTASFDGSANVTPGVTGTLPVANGGTGLTSLDTFVRTTGDQTVGGAKTFSTSITVANNSPSYIVKDANGDWTGTGPYSSFTARDKNNEIYARINFSAHDSRGGGVIALSCRKANSTDFAGMDLNLTSGNCWLIPTDNYLYLGGAANRWKQLYASSTTISTSDEREKRDIVPIPDEVLDAWSSVEFAQFRFNDAFAEKGESARTHSGLVAQRVRRAFDSLGLDVSKYGLFCYDEWDAEEPQYNEKGELERQGREAGNRYALRYEEALCMEAAYMRRENARLKKRVADLEERLAALELRLGSE